MKKRIIILLGVIIIAGAAAGLCWKLGVFGGAADSSNAVYVSKISDITGNVSGVANRYAGVVEPQETVEVELESGRTVKEVQVQTGQEVKQGQLLFSYDLSSIQEDLAETQLEMDRLKNEAASLTEQIATLEKEKKNASQDSQLSYTIEIETNRMNLKKNEYDQKSKQAEIDKLQSATGNTEVRSSIDGVIQKIDTSKLATNDGDSLDSSLDDYSSYSDSGDSGNAFITILSTGAYRIKGMVNEMNADSIIEGDPVIVRSRVDEEQIWRGTMGTVDRESANTDSSSSMYGMVDTGNEQTTSSTYPFYVNLESSDGLMLGQHVYIEMDEGQENKKAGLWLSEFYIVDADTENPYVWAADENKKLEKRSVVLGQYDDTLGEYEIADGLTKNDCIAYPSDTLEEGMPTTTNSAARTDNVDMVPSGDETGTMDDGVMDDTGMTDDGMMTDDSWAADDSGMTDDTGMTEDEMWVTDDGMATDDSWASDTGTTEDEMWVTDDGMMTDDAGMMDDGMTMDASGAGDEYMVTDDDAMMADDTGMIEDSEAFEDFEITDGNIEEDLTPLE